jgi:hypothetical protein
VVGEEPLARRNGECPRIGFEETGREDLAGRFSGGGGGRGRALNGPRPRLGVEGGRATDVRGHGGVRLRTELRQQLRILGRETGELGGLIDHAAQRSLV